LIAEPAHTILIVEDEAMLRITLVEYLTDCGFHVVEAANADEAVLILAKPDIAIDIVFTDVRMPGSLDGFGLAKWVRENRPALPVLIASGNVGIANLAHELCEGEKLFAKPYNLDEIEGHIRQTIALRKRA
jgi:DNA-binding NtrC family response regulator